MTKKFALLAKVNIFHYALLQLMTHVNINNIIVPYLVTDATVPLFCNYSILAIVPAKKELTWL